jgi:glycyl-tRNA synthetase beta subunit
MNSTELRNFAAVSFDMFNKPEDDLEKYKSLPTNLAEAVKNAEKKKNEQMLASIAEQVIEILGTIDTEINNLVTSIRAQRKIEKKLLAQVKRITKAKELALESGNFVPVLNELYGYGIFPNNINSKDLKRCIDSFYSEK